MAIKVDGGIIRSVPEQVAQGPAPLVVGPVKQRWRTVYGPAASPATRELIREWAERDRWPGDRPVERPIVNMLQQALDNGTFRPPEWAWCKVLENGKVYAMNGKHSSLVLSKNVIPEGLVISITGYECDTMADAAALYGTFDPRSSGRSSKAIYASYASVVDQIQHLHRDVIALVTAGVGYAHWEDQYNQTHSNAERAEKMMEFPDFALMVDALMDGHRKDVRTFRSPVVAAMFKTWRKHGEACVPFWEEVRDESNVIPNAPSRVLKRWLMSASLISRKVHGIKNSTNHEMMVRCIHAWNAYKRGRTEIQTLVYFANKGTPEVV